VISVDVIVPTFNSGGLLREALESIRAQTMPAHHIIVVDDGSTDGAVAPSIAGFANVSVIRRENAGVSVARNTGAAASEADCIIFVDHDDLLSANALEALVGGMGQRPGVDLCHAWVQEFVDDRLPLPEGVRRAGEALPARLSGCTLVRRSLWTRVGGCVPGLNQGEWIDWIDRAYAAGAVVTNIDTVVLHRRIHGRNFTGAAAGKVEYLAVARAALLRRRGKSG
jgi:glycosyltransferase involved in cell wall biosynthesis